MSIQIRRLEDLHLLLRRGTSWMKVMCDHYCKKCNLSFCSFDEFNEHNLKIHMRGFMINTDSGANIMFSRIDFGKFMCPSCFTPCSNFEEITLHLFCEVSMKNSDIFQALEYKTNVENDNIIVEALTDKIRLHDDCETTDEIANEMIDLGVTEQYEFMLTAISGNNIKTDQSERLKIKEKSNTGTKKFNSQKEKISKSNSSNTDHENIYSDHTHMDNVTDDNQVSFHKLNNENQQTFNSVSGKAFEKFSRKRNRNYIVNDRDKDLIEYINQLYEDDFAGPYYIQTLRKIPTTFDNGSTLTWSKLSRIGISSSRRNTPKWNELKKVLLELKLLEERPDKIIKRNFE